jgi:hypothetical protein
LVGKARRDIQGRKGLSEARGGDGFNVLLFRSSKAAAAALSDRRVVRYFRAGHIPAVRRGNVVLANKAPINLTDLRRWTAVLQAVGH